eukprot:5884199-Amphidinium_carterae.1
MLEHRRTAQKRCYVLSVIRLRLHNAVASQMSDTHIVGTRSWPSAIRDSCNLLATLLTILQCKTYTTLHGRPLKTHPSHLPTILDAATPNVPAE